MPVYIDLLIVLNFLVDLCLLLATDRLAGHPSRWKRVLSGAAVGGLYGGVCVIPGLTFLGGTLWRAIVLLLIGGAAFGFGRDALRRCVLFLLLSMALGGVAMGMQGSVWTLIGSAAGLCAMCLVGFRGRLGEEYVPVMIRFAGQTLRFDALRDTGNSLKDPLRWQQILVVSASIARRLTGLSSRELADPVKTMGAVEGLRLIPFHSVGRSGGVLAAKRYEDVTIGAWQGSCLVAFAPNELGQGQPYEALTGGTV